VGLIARFGCHRVLFWVSWQGKLSVVLLAPSHAFRGWRKRQLLDALFHSRFALILTLSLRSVVLLHSVLLAPMTLLLCVGSGCLQSYTPLIEGVPAATYVRSFRWDEAKFTSSDTLDSVRASLIESSSRLEAGLKVRLTDYTAAKQAVTAVARRTGGNLLSRSLAGIVTREHVMAPDSEHLTTVFVVVPRFSTDEFLGEYENLCVPPPASADAPAVEPSKFMGVVPRSAIPVVTDGDHAMYAVTLFRAGVEAFKMGCRDRRYTVREYEFTPTAADDAAEEASRVEAEATSSAAAFGAWTSTAYAEAFMVALHLKVLRVYVESVLRYGLPVDFDVTAVFPAGSKGVSRVRKQLGEMYAHLAGGRGGGGGDAEGVMVPGIMPDKEFFPYVSVDVVMPSVA